MRQKERRCTAADVAAMAGVDTSTVSRVFNRAFAKHVYAPETIRRIDEAARTLGYRPLFTARALRGKRTQLLGLVVSDISNAFFGELAAAVEEAVRPNGYLLAICNTNEDPATQAEHLEGLLSRGVDGLIVSPSGDSGFDKLADFKLPIVTIDRPLPQRKLPHVGTDNIEAGRIIGQHLLSLGYRRILAVGPVVSHERVTGLRNALGNNATLEVCWINEGPIRSKAAAEVADRIKGTRRPQVVVGLTNDSTIGAIDAIGAAGLTIPSQIGVTGIDDFSAASILCPAITTVAQPITVIAQQAAQRLMDLLNDKKVDTEPFLLAPKLIERQSLLRQTSPSGD